MTNYMYLVSVRFHDSILTVIIFVKKNGPIMLPPFLSILYLSTILTIKSENVLFSFYKDKKPRNEHVAVCMLAVLHCSCAEFSTVFYLFYHI